MHAGLDGLTFKVFSTSDLSGEIANHVSLFLYRVDVDRTRRHAELPRIDRQAPERFALALELHYPLTVWSGGTAEREQEILSDSMEILDEHALLSGDLLDSNFPWEEGSEIKVCLESMTNEDMLRLWDSFEPAYHLSVPYLARTLLLRPLERSSIGIVESRTNVWTPAIPL